jgi:uncharacterized membrane protein YqhA
MTLVPVVFLLLDAAGSFIYGTDIFVRTASGVLSEPAKIGGRLGLFLIVMDTFLVGATLMIAAFGFYELFVVKDDNTSDALWLPGWLRMRDLEDLKVRVVSMLILVAAITFVDRTVESQEEQETLFLGIGISIIIAALTAFLWFSRRNPPEADLGIVTEGNGEAAGGGPGGGATGGVTHGGTQGADPPGSNATGLGGLGGAKGPTRPAGAVRQAEPAEAEGAGRSAGEAEVTAPPARVTAILAGTRRAGNWSLARRTDVIAAGGWARLDLREAVLPAQQVEVRVVAGLGVVSITVPPHMEIAESGTTLLGLRSMRGGPAMRPRSGAPTLVLSGGCVLGIVRVRRMP